ncbi:GNAT family N-acetyltransferase [Coleofasciculus sp. F4-SAH-05]|uniref:GNAT family N-acetyltransferase n=1 Tax=Coleofasciculus sp. F4-SAH-05 TaxID=3069525 RepID=UPI0033003992
MSHITFKSVNYKDYSAAIQGVRRSVFHIEQGVDPALDLDGKDETADHILAYVENQAVGTVRVRYLDHQTAKIERLAVLSDFRGRGIGNTLMEEALNMAANQQINTVVIHAQDYVKSLYLKLGFVPEGERFDEAGISHVKMIKSLNSSI